MILELVLVMTRLVKNIGASMTDNLTRMFDNFHADETCFVFILSNHPTDSSTSSGRASSIQDQY
jgi:hypothetical protein